MFENTTATDLAMGRSSVRRRILTVLALPDTRLHLREIQRRAGTSPGTASRELGRLVSAGLIEREAEGNQVYFRGATTPLAMMLRSLLSGPVATRFDTPSQPHAEAAGPTAPTPSRLKRTAPVAFARTTRPAAATALATGPARTERPAAATETAIAALAMLVEPSPIAAIAQLPAVAAPAAATAGDDLGVTIATRFAERIRPIYGERLRGVYLYGARARGEARAHSNVEIVVVLDRVDRYGDELEQTGSTCADLSLEHGLVVSRVFVSESAWLSRSDGQLPTVRKEAVTI
jgi:DNA-binding transcriptional ArsR family regulator